MSSAMNIMIPWQERDRHRPWLLRIATRLAIWAARLVIRLPPNRLRQTLELVSRRATPATADQAQAAIDSVLSASLSLNALKACLPRSVATALLCRMHGTWATWCTGVSVTPPFAAHAWIEVDGQPIGELDDPGRFARMLVVPPRALRHSTSNKKTVTHK